MIRLLEFQNSPDKICQKIKTYDCININVKTDDGWSGNRWDRTGMAKLLDEVDKGTFGAVLCKDMSWAGRDFLRVGLLMEKFREKDVRFIAVNEIVIRMYLSIITGKSLTHLASELKAEGVLNPSSHWASIGVGMGKFPNQNPTRWTLATIIHILRHKTLHVTIK